MATHGLLSPEQLAEIHRDGLEEERFPKLMAYLNHPASRRVRTNNHVERSNRMFRFLEQVRYKRPRRQTLVRFVVLKLDDVWGHGLPPTARTTPLPKAGVKRRKPQRDDGRQPRRVA